MDRLADHGLLVSYTHHLPAGLSQSESSSSLDTVDVVSPAEHILNRI